MLIRIVRAGRELKGSMVDSFYIRTQKFDLRLKIFPWVCVYVYGTQEDTNKGGGRPQNDQRRRLNGSKISQDEIKKLEQESRRGREEKGRTIMTRSRQDRTGDRTRSKASIREGVRCCGRAPLVSDHFRSDSTVICSSLQQSSRSVVGSEKEEIAIEFSRLLRFDSVEDQSNILHTTSHALLRGNE